MNVCDRLRVVRESKNMSQGDIEKKTGLLRCYISRVENGHTVPTVETLEKMARAMEMPLYALMYDGNQPPALANRKSDDGFGSYGKEARFLQKLSGFLSRMNDKDRNLLLGFAENLTKRKRSRA